MTERRGSGAIPLAEVRTQFHPNGDGTFTISSHQDVGDILENNKEWQKHKQTGDGLRRMASIPVVIWQMWLDETGGTLDRMPVRDQYKFVKRKLADPDWAWLRTT